MVNLQDSFLNQIRIAKEAVSIYLTGGQQLKGVVKGFDSFVLLLDMTGKQALVYKHAISSIVPKNPISFLQQDNKRAEKEEQKE